jgi:2-oxoisovalerate dehydrogenase E2 component (dihydrolipoyl transacylase)
VSATRTFAVPDLGEGLDTVTIVQWLVERGDHVALNQTLCVVETAKAEVDIPSPHDGVVQDFGGADGDTLAVGSMLATFTLADDPDGANDDQGLPGTAPTTSSATQTLVGYGPDATLDKSRRPLASPAVRKAALDADISLRDIAPTTANGVITHNDLALHRTATSTAPAATKEPGYQVVAVSGVRARIAEQMSLSRRTIADATCTIEVDATRLLEVRSLLNDALVGQPTLPTASGGKAPSVTSFALLCALVTNALSRNEVLNSTFVDEANEIHVHRAIHLGIGTATPRGLTVAVVRDAHRRSLVDLCHELARVTGAAKAGHLAPSDMVGSTFTISNLGSLGLDGGIPIINAPQAAILGIGSIKPRPWVVDAGLAVRSTVSLTLAFDHRVCDGTEAALFMNDLRQLIEQPERLLLSS